MTLSKIIRASLVAGVAAFGLVGPAAAQDITDSHLSAARSAMAAIKATDVYDSILPEAAEALRASLIANNPDLEAEINDLVTEEAVNIASRRTDLENEIARIFARAIREEDLVAIAAFYQTDAGRALLENGPIATREASRAALVWRSGIERDLRDAVNQRLVETNPRANVEGAAATDGAQTAN